MTVTGIYNTPFSNRKSIQKELATWLTASNWRSICGVTLTLKQGLRLEGTNAWARINETRAKDAFRHFMRVLNKKIYGRRFKERLRVIPILEKSERWHYHIAIEPPDYEMTADQFAATVRYCWSKVHWAYEDIQFKAGVNQGWITNYILKNKNGQKNEFGCVFVDCVDIGSLNL